MVIVSANENLKNLLRRSTNQDLSFYQYFLCSSFAGVLAASFTTPIDNIKTWLNVQKLAKFISHNEPKEKVLNTEKVY